VRLQDELETPGKSDARNQRAGCRDRDSEDGVDAVGCRRPRAVVGKDGRIRLWNLCSGDYGPPVDVARLEDHQ